jgi:hypothetical protein
MKKNIDFKNLLEAMKRANAVYQDSDDMAKQAFESIGCKLLGRYSDHFHQAVVCITPDNSYEICISGTRVTDGTIAQTIADLSEDVYFYPHDIGQGAKVAKGAYFKLDEVFTWALSFIPETEMIQISGHSLGGQRAHLTPLFVPIDRIKSIYSFAPPKAANKKYWEQYENLNDVIFTVVCEDDPWFAWPWKFDELEHPEFNELIWLHDDTYSLIYPKNWPGGNVLNQKNHYPETYINKLNSIVNTNTQG